MIAEVLQPAWWDFEMIAKYFYNDGLIFFQRKLVRKLDIYSICHDWCEIQPSVTEKSIKNNNILCEIDMILETLKRLFTCLVLKLSKKAIIVPQRKTKISIVCEMVWKPTISRYAVE